MRKRAKINNIIFYSASSFKLIRHERRDKQKHVLGDVKQEKQKADIALLNTSSSTLNESNAFSLNIKQEDTKNDSSLLKQKIPSLKSVI